MSFHKIEIVKDHIQWKYYVLSLVFFTSGKSNGYQVMI